MTEKHKRFEELDALRGIAALFVVFFHFTMGRTEYNTIFKLGTTGVDLFFIISGFVIFMSLEKISKGRDFVINRISRLYPTYWAVVSFTFLLHFYTEYKGKLTLTDLLVQFLGNLTMFQFYLRLPDLDGPYWTLIIEMLFYIAIFLLFKIKWLKYLNIIGIVLCSSMVLLTHYFGGTQLINQIIYFIPLFQFLPLFLVGTVFYKIYTKKEKLVQNYLVVVFCLLCQIALYPYAGRSNGFINWTEYSFMLVAYFGIFTLFVNNSLTFIVNRTTLFLGKISYALYLVHQYISLSFIIPLFYNQLELNFWVVTILINLPIVIGLATIITYKIEAPYSKLMKEKLRTTRGLR